MVIGLKVDPISNTPWVNELNKFTLGVKLILFGSKLFREFLFNADGEKNPNVFYNLQTNGGLFTPRYWHKMEKIHKQINTILISVDAATKEVYDVVRRGGNWKLLNQNLLFMKELKAKKKIKYT